jgi:hypothetical protein
MPDFAGLRLLLAAAGSRKTGKKALSRLEALFSEGAPPSEIAGEFALAPARLEAIERLASAPDGWYPVPDIIHEKDPEKSRKTLLSLCRRGLAHVSPLRNAVRLSDAGRYILILCSAKGDHPHESLAGAELASG